MDAEQPRSAGFPRRKFALETIAGVLGLLVIILGTVTAVEVGNIMRLTAYHDYDVTWYGDACYAAVIGGSGHSTITYKGCGSQLPQRFRARNLMALFLRQGDNGTLEVSIEADGSFCFRDSFSPTGIISAICNG